AAAPGAAAQRMDPQLDLVSRLERRPLPAFLRQVVGARHLDRPALGPALCRRVDLDESVRVLPFEAHHGGIHGDRLLHIEHRVAVVRQRRRRREQAGCEQELEGLHCRVPHSCGTLTGVPFLGSPESSTLPSAFLRSRNSPPWWPSRSGAIRTLIFSPAFSDVRRQPCRVRLFGLFSSIAQRCTRPETGTSSSMNACGLVHWNSCTVPSSVICLDWSNMAKL